MTRICKFQNYVARFGKACIGNLIKFRETEIQRHIWNPVKHKIELL